jgi:hypothetical protein
LPSPPHLSGPVIARWKITHKFKFELYVYFGWVDHQSSICLEH